MANFKRKYNWIGFDGWRYQPESSLDITMCTLYRRGYSAGDIEKILNVTAKVAKRVYIFCDPHSGSGANTKWIQRILRVNAQ